MSTPAGGNGQAPTQPQVPGSGSGPAPTTPPNNTASSDGGPNGQAPTAYSAPSEDDWKRSQQELAEARRDAAKYREEIKKREEAQLSEQEKLQKNYTDLQEKYATLEVEHQSLRLSTQVAQAAQALGFIDYDDAYRMLLTGGELETDDTGNYKNLVKLLEKLAAAKPYLLAATTNTQPRANFPTSGGATNPGRSAAPPPTAPAPSGREQYEQHKRAGGLGNPNLWKRNP